MNADEVVATPKVIATTAASWPVRCAGLGEAPRPREKLSPDGRGTFTTGAVLITANPDGTVRANKTASINVVEADPAGYSLGTTYAAQGKIWVTPYTPDGSGARTQLSITVERLVPVGAPSPAKRGE